MNDEQLLLASAYLDGALTDEERARAEADSDVMAAVERLGQLRHTLATVEPPDRARRDVAINAALGVFDAEVRVATPPPVTSLSARRWARWLMPAAAAAVVLILAGGILATQNGDGDGDDSAGGGATTAEGEVRLNAAEDQSAADTAPSRTSDSSSAGGQERATAATTDGAVTEAPGTFLDVTVGVVLTSPEELTAFASSALLETADRPAAAALPTCDKVRGQWLGPATYVENGVDTQVEIYLAERAGEVRAVDTATCTVIVTAPAP